MGKYKILVINPGSTTTKISVFSEDKELYKDTIVYDYKKLGKFDKVIDQKELRYKSIVKSLKKSNYKIRNFSVIISRGGILGPVEAGIYKINKKMLEDLQNQVGGEHASNIGAFIAYKIMKEEGIPAYIADPVSVDEMIDIARISGFKGIERKSQSHALNIRRVAYLWADKLNKNLDELNFIIAHLGGGISIGALRKGRLIDVESANSLGPFSPERSGSLPFQEIIDLIDKGEYSPKELKRKLLTEAGIYSYLYTKDMVEVENRIKSGDQEAKLILEAMVYQISKGIGEMATVLKGRVDRIILTGGIAYSDLVCQKIKERVAFISKLERVAGEAEMLGLKEAAMRLLRKEELAKEYKGVDRKCLKTLTV